MEQDTSGFDVERATEGLPVSFSSFSDEELRDSATDRWLPSTACVEPTLGEADLFGPVVSALEKMPTD